MTMSFLGTKMREPIQFVQKIDEWSESFAVRCLMDDG